MTTFTTQTASSSIRSCSEPMRYWFPRLHCYRAASQHRSYHEDVDVDDVLRRWRRGRKTTLYAYAYMYICTLRIRISMPKFPAQGRKTDTTGRSRWKKIHGKIFDARIAIWRIYTARSRYFDKSVVDCAIRFSSGLLDRTRASRNGLMRYFMSCIRVL